MKKKYEIFISSTYEDLKIERETIGNAIIKMGHFPSRMEDFPASSRTQWELIKPLILDCDYYVLILGGRYGSIDADSGMSYTQMEYMLANEIHKPILSFILNPKAKHKSNKSSEADEIKGKLEAFRADVKKRLCVIWDTPIDLVTDFIISLSNEIEINPQRGWVRGPEKIDGNGNGGDNSIGAGNSIVNDSGMQLISDNVKHTLPSWQILLQREDYSSKSFKQALEDVFDKLSKASYTEIEPVASMAFLLHSLNDCGKINLIEGQKKSILHNINTILLSCPNTNTLIAVKDKFYSIFKGLTKDSEPESLQQIKLHIESFCDLINKKSMNSMIYLLENITDDNAIDLIKCLGRTLPNSTATYANESVFDKVNVEKMMESVKMLSEKGLSTLTSFFIERYMLRFSSSLSVNFLNFQSEVEKLKLLSVQLTGLCKDKTDKRLRHYNWLKYAVSLSIQRCSGVGGILLKYSLADINLIDLIEKTRFQVITAKKGSSFGSLTGFGSGFWINYKDHCFFVTADHVIHPDNHKGLGVRQWNSDTDDVGIYTNLTVLNSNNIPQSEIATLNGFTFLESFNLMSNDISSENVGTPVDVAFTSLTQKQINHPYYTKRIVGEGQSVVVNEGERKFPIEESAISTPNAEDIYSVYGCVRFSVQSKGLVPYLWYQDMYHSHLKYIRKDGDYIVLQSPYSIDYKDWVGLSGSAVFNQNGGIIGVLCAVENNGHSVFVLDINFITKFFDIDIMQENIPSQDDLLKQVNAEPANNDGK